MFGWGPSGSGLIAYTDRDGHLKLLDRDRHRQTVSGVKDALLPAWSADGLRLAYMKKGKRQQYTLLCSTVTR
jgi:Tol biopolymer transport system component